MSKQRLGVVAAFLIMAMGVASQAATLVPGGIEVWGQKTEQGLFELTFQLEAPSAQQAQIHAVQFYSEPSHTPLAVVANQNAPAQVLTRGQGLSPRALARVVLAGAPVTLYLAPPPATDTTIRLEYTLEVPTGLVEVLMAEATPGSLNEFHFSVEVAQTMMMPVVRECTWCGTMFCGCTSCERYTWNCPYCELDCL